LHHLRQVAREGSLNEGQKLSYESKLDSMARQDQRGKPSRHVRRADCEIFLRMYLPQPIPPVFGSAPKPPQLKVVDNQ
jgi:hypothetical protein